MASECSFCGNDTENKACKLCGAVVCKDCDLAHDGEHAELAEQAAQAKYDDHIDSLIDADKLED